jgi:hypothetical protein
MLRPGYLRFTSAIISLGAVIYYYLLICMIAHYERYGYLMPYPPRGWPGLAGGAIGYQLNAIIGLFSELVLSIRWLALPAAFVTCAAGVS